MAEKTKLKILVVEDDRYIRNLYLLKLKKEGYEVEFAGDGQEGVNVYASFAPDLIILDLLLPGTDGFAFLEEVKQKQKVKTPVIVLSNLGQPENIERAMKLGAEEYLVKVNTEVTELIGKINDRLKK